MALFKRVRFQFKCNLQQDMRPATPPPCADSALHSAPSDFMALDACDEDQIYKYFTLTVARYSSDDRIGKYVALVTLSPIYLAVAYMTLVVVRRDLQTFILAVGHVFDLAINKLLKTHFAEARPCGCVNTGHGMPSNHTQYMFFFASFSTLYLWSRVSYTTEAKVGLTTTLAGWASLVGFTRMHLQCHTFQQVAAGAVVGSSTGGLWYLFYSKVLLPWCPTVANWRISRALYVKDYSQVPHVLEFEHANLHGAGVGVGDVRDRMNGPKKTR